MDVIQWFCIICWNAGYGCETGFIEFFFAFFWVFTWFEVFWESRCKIFDLCDSAIRISAPVIVNIVDAFTVNHVGNDKALSHEVSFLAVGPDAWDVWFESIIAFEHF